MITQAEAWKAAERASKAIHNQWLLTNPHRDYYAN